MRNPWLLPAVAALLWPGAVMAQSGETGAVVLPLPEAAAYPEGITVDPATGLLYAVSANTGVVVRLNPDTGHTEVVGDPLDQANAAEPSPISVSLGLKADGEGRLWVAGARTGSMHVVDLSTGRLLARFTTPEGAAVINDVVLTPDAAYFTDTVRPYLWRVPREDIQDAALEPWLSFDGTALQYDPEGGNLNGIAATPDGRYLVVVQMRAGRLFRIDTQTREVTAIDAGDSALSGGDGLVLDGQRLYLVRQSAEEVVALDMSDDLTTATEVGRVKPEELAWPATAALRGDRLIVANSQLNRRSSGDPELPFGVVSIPLSAFD